MGDKLPLIFPTVQNAVGWQQNTLKLWFWYVLLMERFGQICFKYQIYLMGLRSGLSLKK